MALEIKHVELFDLHQTTWVIEKKDPPQTIPQYQYQPHRRGEVGNDSNEKNMYTL